MREISCLLLFGSSRGKSGAVGARSSRRPCEKFCSQIRGFLVCSSPARRSALVSRPFCDARSSASACCAPPGFALGFFFAASLCFAFRVPEPVRVQCSERQLCRESSLAPGRERFLEPTDNSGRPLGKEFSAHFPVAGSSDLFFGGCMHHVSCAIVSSTQAATGQCCFRQVAAAPLICRKSSSPSEVPSRPSGGAPVRKKFDAAHPSGRRTRQLRKLG